MESEFTELRTYASEQSFFATGDGGTLRFVFSPIDLSQIPDNHEEERIQIDPHNPNEDAEIKAYETEMQSSLVTFSFALGFEEKNESVGGWDRDSDVCFCRTRVSDAEGQVWEAKSLFTADLLLSGVLDCGRESLVIPRGGELEKLFQTRPLLLGIRGFYDTRETHCMVFDAQAQFVRFKYQYPVFDIAFNSDIAYGMDNSNLVVRISELYSDEEKKRISALYFMDCMTLMFHSQSDRMPVPLIFRKTGDSGLKQKIVRYFVPGMPFPN